MSHSTPPWDGPTGSRSTPSWPAPYDPTCNGNKNGFVGCVVITCQTFGGTFGHQMDTVIQQVAQQIRYSSPTASVVSLGSAAADRATINVAFPPSP